MKYIFIFLLLFSSSIFTQSVLRNRGENGLNIGAGVGRTFDKSGSVSFSGMASYTIEGMIDFGISAGITNPDKDLKGKSIQPFVSIDIIKEDQINPCTIELEFGRTFTSFSPFENYVSRFETSSKAFHFGGNIYFRIGPHSEIDKYTQFGVGIAHVTGSTTIDEYLKENNYFYKSGVRFRSNTEDIEGNIFTFGFAIPKAHRKVRLSFSPQLSFFVAKNGVNNEVALTFTFLVMF